MQFYDTTMTSKSDPLRIDEVAITSFKGKIGISICPGKNGASIEYIADYDRDIGSDLDVVKRCHVTLEQLVCALFRFKSNHPTGAGCKYRTNNATTGTDIKHKVTWTDIGMPD